jgi:hypothetical protein
MNPATGRILFPILLLVLIPSGAFPCDVPAGYSHVATLEEGDLVVSLAVDKETYHGGDPVNFYLGIQNTGENTIQASCSQSPMNIFSVMREDCLSLEIPCREASLFFYPEVVYYFGETIAVPPGECVTRTATWDGWLTGWDGHVVKYLPEPGSYVILAGLYQVLLTEPHMDMVIPDNGITLPIVLDSQVPAETATWGRLKARYGDSQ